MGDGTPAWPWKAFRADNFDVALKRGVRNDQIQADRKIAMAFPIEDYASFAANQSFLAKAGFEIIDKGAGIRT